jgi:hypothetical protein
MLFKAIGQPLGTVKGKLLGNAQRLLDTLLTILKGYWKTAGKSPNNTETCWATVPIRRML